MKHKLFILISLPLILAATGCGKSEDQPVAQTASVAAVGTVTCPNGQVQSNQYPCGTTQYGQPPGYTGPGNYCNGQGTGQCWNNGYSWNSGYNGGYPNQGGYGYSYHWWYSGGYYYYW